MGVYAGKKEVLAPTDVYYSCTSREFDCADSGIGRRAVHLYLVLAITREQPTKMALGPFIEPLPSSSLPGSALCVLP